MSKHFDHISKKLKKKKKPKVNLIKNLRGELLLKKQVIPNPNLINNKKKVPKLIALN